MFVQGTTSILSANNPSSALGSSQIMTSSVDAAILLYNELLELPSVSRATFLSDNLLHLDLSHRSLAELSKRSSTQSIILTSSSSPSSSAAIATTPLTAASADIIHTCYAHSGSNRSAIFRKLLKDRKGKDKTRLRIEIWSDGAKQEELDVHLAHGDWLMNDTFGFPSFDPTGTSIVYTAEALPPSALLPSPSSTSSAPDQADYEYYADFGETFTGKARMEVYLLLLKGSPYRVDHATPELHRVTTSGREDNVLFGTPAFLPVDPSAVVPRLVATGFAETMDGRKMGIVYCTNRSTAIYELMLERTSDDKWATTSTQRLSSPLVAARSPRVIYPSASTARTAGAPEIIFLANSLEGPHNSCGALISLTAITATAGDRIGYRQSVLVDVVANVKAGSSDDAFHGLFADGLVSSCVVSIDGQSFAVLSSQNRSRKVLYSVDLHDGHLTSLTPWMDRTDDPVFPYLIDGSSHDHLLSFSLLCTDGKDVLVAIRSGMTRLPELVIGALQRIDGEISIEWQVIRRGNASPKLASSLSSLSSTILPLPHFSSSEILLVSPIPISPSAPARYNLPPLLTIPHGGPHAAYSTEFSAQVACYAIAGYRVALLNFPGSTAYGQDFVEELVPHTGQLDVDASIAVPHYLNTLSLASRTKGKRLFSGGSHGGYIGSFCAAKYPKEFDAVLLRNPVIDLVQMVSSSDIPDWTYAETNLPYSFSSPPRALSPANFAHLYERSPLSFVDLVVVPTMLHIGDGDRRVPPDQGRSWYHALRSNRQRQLARQADGAGKEGEEEEEVGRVEMLIFKGNGHQLSTTVDAEMIGFSSGLKFLAEFTDF